MVAFAERDRSSRVGIKTKNQAIINGDFENNFTSFDVGKVLNRVKGNIKKTNLLNW